MTALVLALALAASCEHPALATLAPEQQEVACRLVGAPDDVAVGQRPALEEIYARPGFERARLRNTGALQAWFAQLKVWFESLIQTSGAETYSNVTRVAVLALALALATGLALRLLARRRAQAAPRSEVRPAQPLRLDDPAAHQARAEALLVATPREAVREAWLALLSSLERRRFARPDRAKTNRELLAELPRRGAPAELVSAVSPLFDWFDRTWYSLEPVAPDVARRFLDDVRKVTA